MQYAPASDLLHNGGTLARRSFSAGGELNQTTQVYDLYYRNYDPVLGRFGQVDPMASKFASLTPYNYGNNDPVFYSDPLGDCPTCGCEVCDAPNLVWSPQRAYEGGSLTPFEEFMQFNFSKQYGSANGAGGMNTNYGAARGQAFNERMVAQMEVKNSAYRQAYSQGKELDYNKNGDWGWWEDGGDGLEYSFNEKGQLVITRRPIVTSKFHKLGSSPTILDRIFKLLPGQRDKGSETLVSVGTNIQVVVKKVGGFTFNPFSQVLRRDVWDQSGESHYVISATDSKEMMHQEFGFAAGWGVSYKNVWETDEIGTLNGHYNYDVSELAISFWGITGKISWGTEGVSVFYGLSTGAGLGGGIGGSFETWDGNVVKFN